MLLITLLGRTCYVSFKERYGEDYSDVLEAFINLHDIKQPCQLTVQQRFREFKKHVSRVEKAAQEGVRSKFETIFISVGSCVNEDASLTHVWCSPGLDGVSPLLSLKMQPLRNLL